MNPFQHFDLEVKNCLGALQGEGHLPSDLNLTHVKVEAPKDAGHGDLATNAAMVLAKQAKMPPRDIAELLASKLELVAGVLFANVAGPGFINLKLDHSFWQSQLSDILGQGQAFGKSDIGANEKVNVEYVSANPTGPMHVGHCRGAVFGDALANLLETAGYDVTREYYINDAGAQVDVLARSAFLRYREALGDDIGDIPEGLYPGDYLVPVGQKLAAEHGNALKDQDEANWLPIVRDVSIDSMMDMIRDDLSALGIAQDVFFSERTLHQERDGTSAISSTIGALEKGGLIYEGVLEPPKGKKPDDWEEREQTLFRATDFGDDTDRPLKKSDGSYTYFASDIAYHLNKFERGYSTLIDVWGADHAGYIKRMSAAVKAISQGDATLDVKVCQLVRLFRDGEPVRMSKRAGNFVTLREVVDEVGSDVVRFMMLYRKNDATLDFDFAKVTEQSKDNPVFYVQYAHARVHSVLRTAEDTLPGIGDSPKDFADSDFSLLGDESEYQLIKLMSAFPRAVENAAQAHEPHRIAFYLYDLASEFHALWNKGKEDESLRFVLGDNVDLTKARLGLIVAVAQTIAVGLGILGVKPVKEMR